MFALKLTSLLTLGAFSAQVIILYLNRIKAYRLIQAVSLLVVALSVKNYVLRLVVGYGASLPIMVSINYGDALSWLAFGCGYAGVAAYLFHGCNDNEAGQFTASVTDICLVIFPLFLLAMATYTIYYL